MPITIEGRHEGVGVIYHCHGDMTFEDFFQAGIGFLAFPEAIKKWKYCILDLTSVGAMSINFDDIDRRVGRAEQAHCRHRASRGASRRRFPK
jgi:hypothetical protein